MSRGRLLLKVSGALCVSVAAFTCFISSCACLAGHPQGPAWLTALCGASAMAALYGTAAFAALALVIIHDNR